MYHSGSFQYKTRPNVISGRHRKVHIAFPTHSRQPAAHHPVGMGWGIIFFLPQAMNVLGKTGFMLLLAGGITYTIGAILYGNGTKRRWMHSVFHIFVVLGSILQFLSIYYFVI